MKSRKIRLPRTLLSVTLALLVSIVATAAVIRSEHQSNQRSEQPLAPATQTGQEQPADDDVQNFIPTKKVTADQYVVFPTDI